MGHSRQRLGFAQRPLVPTITRGYLQVTELERHLAIELFVVSSKHRPHAADTQLVKDHEPANLGLVSPRRACASRSAEQRIKGRELRLCPVTGASYELLWISRVISRNLFARFANRVREQDTPTTQELLRYGVYIQSREPRSAADRREGCLRTQTPGYSRQVFADPPSQSSFFFTPQAGVPADHSDAGSDP